jgi:hypothetical protein
MLLQKKSWQKSGGSYNCRRDGFSETFMVGERKKRWWRVEGGGEGEGEAVKKFTISPATPPDCFPPFSLK